jgi:hypothetical protein
MGATPSVIVTANAPQPTNQPDLKGVLDQELGRAMEGNKVVQGVLEEGEKRCLPAKGKAEESIAAAAASSPAAVLTFLMRPLSLLRHTAHGCAGYLGGLASRLKVKRPAAAAADAAAAACQPQQEEGTVEAAAVVTVSTSTHAEIKATIFFKRKMQLQAPCRLSELN